MAVDTYLHVYFIILLISSTGSSAEMFVRTGDSVQLNIQEHPLPEFDVLAWKINDTSDNIVTYRSMSKKVTPHPYYKDRVDFNNKNFSLTLKNMQKNDSGFYRARATGDSDTYIAQYKISVTDPVKAPVLTVNSVWSSSDSCTVNFTCRAHDITLNSIYNSSSCSTEEVTSHEFYTLILDCSKESIICNHSNPVSRKTNSKDIKELCKESKKQSDQHPSSYSNNVMHAVWISVVVAGGAVIGVVCWRRRSKQEPNNASQQE